MGEPLSDCSPLIAAASSGKLRLVRLLVEGGAGVNGRGPAGETPLLAACQALRGQPTGPGTLRLLAFLLHNKADPNAQDQAGRTALMYACRERAGPKVASTLLAAGADPTMEDRCGASALVYAIDAQDQPTLKVLLDACQAKGRDIIIITTEMDATGGPLMRHYLNVPPSPKTSSVSCMSPSDIVLKTGSPNSPEAGNIFNFQGQAGQTGSGSCSSSRSTPLTLNSLPPRRQRVMSEPWPTIPDRRRFEKAWRGRSSLEEGRDEDWGGVADQGGGDERTSRLREEMWRYQGGSLPRISQSLVSLTDSSHMAHRKPITPEGLRLPPRGEPPPNHLRRNTLPSLQVTPPSSGAV